MERTTVPPGWNTFTLGELFELSNGVNADKSAYGEGVPFVNVLDVIENEALAEADIPGRITLPPLMAARYHVRYGDVLLNRTSETQDEVALASVYLGASPVLFGGFVFRARPKTSRLDTGYSKYALRLSQVREQIVARGQGGIRTNVGQRDLKTVHVMLPPVDEQRTISEALTDLDELISSLRRLIVKKQAIKQGILQQLLVGKTRLPGFTDPWAEVLLGKYVSYVKTAALSRAQLDSESPVRYLHYGDIHTRSIVKLDAAHEALPRAKSALLRNAGRLDVGDLVFADASEDPDGVGKSVEVASVPDAGVVPGLHTIAARFDKAVLADGFKAYLQFIPSFRNALLRLVAGTKVLATTRSFISSITLTLPCIDEQRAIAAVIADTDREISTLLVRLAKARDVRRGVMQELLTGRTRLPVKESVP